MILQNQMSKKNIVSVIVLLVLVAGVAFYGGNTYAKSKVPARGQRTMGAQAFGAGAFAGRGGATGGFTIGQIIAKDAKSITVGVQGGGSKIIFLDSNTKISKQATATLADLVNGTQVTVTGAANSDGSINATAVQIRPNMPAAVVQ